MKTLKICLFASLFLLLASVSSSAQIRDSFPWFKQPSKLLTPKVMDWNASYSLSAPQQALLGSTSTSIAGKQIRIPKDVKILKSPITLKRGDACYQVTCDQNKSCDNCQMFWKDLNSDRKIQPRQELRCVCPKSGDNCGLRGRKVDCK